MKIIDGGITSPIGFKASGIAVGIKRSGKLDLALIYSETPAISAGVFTRNSIKAAPLVVSQENIKGQITQAIIINSGNANCFTGNAGLKHAQKTCVILGKALKIPAKSIVVSSTGIIGKPLPFEKIENSLSTLIASLDKKGGLDAAKAILTTDLVTKEIAVEITIAGKKVTLGACAKGSGMTAPNMGTMLAYISTDAAISPALLKSALAEATDKSFNSITVDGCMSTNDMVVVMANGLAGNKNITTKNKDYETFLNALIVICKDLAKKIVLDGEGATKFIEVKVSGAKNHEQAKQLGLAIANSNLVKTAAHGSNPNWGRVAAAVGSLGIAAITEKNLKIKFSPFTEKFITISVDVKLGKHTATIYTSDLSLEYVRINAEYN